MCSNKLSPHNIGTLVCEAHGQTSLTGLHQVPHCLHRDLQICAGAPLLSGGDLGPEEDIWVSDPCDHLPVASPGHQLRSLPQEPLLQLSRSGQIKLWSILRESTWKENFNHCQVTCKAQNIYIASFSLFMTVRCHLRMTPEKCPKPKSVATGVNVCSEYDIL